MEPVVIDKNRCKGCGLCVEFCPKHCLRLSDGLNPIGYRPADLHDPGACTSCALCAAMCPEGGIDVYRKRKSTQPRNLDSSKNLIQPAARSEDSP